MPSSESGQSEPEGPWDRLQSLAELALTPVPIGGQVEPVPEDFKQWGKNTTLVMAAGLALGTFRQWWVERKMPDVPPPSSMPTKAHVARFKAEMQTRRLVRLLNSTVRGGLWCGSLGGVYYAVQGLSLYARQEDDAYNTVFGAWAAGGLMGLALGSGGITKRLGSVALGAGLAGLVGFPVGLTQQYLESKTNPEKALKFKRPPPEEVELPYKKGDTSIITDLVDDMETRMHKSSGSSEHSKSPP